MLGIRYINDTAIDLWVGEGSSFVTDIKSSSDLKDIKSCIQQSNDQKLRHLGIVLDRSNDIDVYKQKVLEIFDNIKQELNNIDYPKRITLILDRKEDYYIVQEIMFKTILKR